MNKRKFYSDGFTLVELLIVIVIIGVLAGISVAAYSGVQKSARDSTVQSDLSNAMKQLAMYEVENGKAPSTSAELSTVNIKPTKSAYNSSRQNFYYCANISDNKYSIGVATKDNNYFIANSVDGIESVNSVTANETCQAIGLTNTDDTNAYPRIGYNNTTKVWETWIK